MKMVPVQSAIGMVLCHDVTQIVPGRMDGPAFRKGHILREQDAPQLLNMGKEHVFARDIQSDSGLLHENEAAARIAHAALFEVNAAEFVFATLHTHRRVGGGKVLAGPRVISPVIEERKIERTERICSQHQPPIEVLPFRRFNVGTITTGSEVFHGRIKDRFGAVVREKPGEFGRRTIGQTLVSDCRRRINGARWAVRPL